MTSTPCAPRLPGISSIVAPPRREPMTSPPRPLRYAPPELIDPTEAPTGPPLRWSTMSAPLMDTMFAAAASARGPGCWADGLGGVCALAFGGVVGLCLGEGDWRYVALCLGMIVVFVARGNDWDCGWGAWYVWVCG